ncbi:MAG: hypothetical protein ACK44F_10580 [Roseococcus sp.]
MPIDLDQAKRIIADEMAGNGDRKPGWDGRLNSAILVIFGEGSAHVGRSRLVKAAAELLAKNQSR